MAKIYINSTLTTNQQYTTYSQDAAGKPIKTGSVFIKGGANIYIPSGVKPLAVQTEVTQEQLEQLLANPVFTAHRANGFIEITDKSLKDGELAEGLELADEAAPLSDAKIKAKSKSKLKAEKVE